MKNSKTANDLLHTNQEYEKLKHSRVGNVDKTPRETPGGQGPGRRGYGKEVFAEWTREEIEHKAHTLDIEFDEDLTREELIELLDAHDATLRRSR